MSSGTFIKKEHSNMSDFRQTLESLSLTRYPQTEKNLQPWNAADEYLYNAATQKSGEITRVLILNDDTGIFPLLFPHIECFSIHDSLYAQKSLEKNLAQNDYKGTCHFIPSTQIETLSSQQPFDTVLIKIPKSVPYLKDQLRSLRHLFAKDTTLFISGMVKHISNTMKKTLEGYIGPTTVSKILKKAILFTSIVRQTKSEKSSLTTFKIDSLGTFSSYVNTFSKGKLDQGTLELLAVLPDSIEGTVVDLGCGFGPISRAIAAQQNKTDRLFAVDISYMATASTKLNVPVAETKVTDGLTEFEDNSLNWVVSNPPFHNNTTFSVNEGLRLFKQVHKKLIIDGKFCMVANRGLHYYPYLEKLFGTVQVLSESKKYTVFLCTKEG